MSFETRLTVRLESAGRLVAKLLAFGSVVTLLSGFEVVRLVALVVEEKTVKVKQCFALEGHQHT